MGGEGKPSGFKCMFGSFPLPHSPSMGLIEPFQGPVSEVLRVPASTYLISWTPYLSVSPGRLCRQEPSSEAT